jgi:hypothetical protein
MTFKRAACWAGALVALVVASAATLIVWPSPVFAYSAGTGKVIVVSDEPIPAAGGERFVQQCEALLARSPLTAPSPHYRIYVTNTAWRHHLFFLLHPEASGVAYTLPRGGTAFLAGADFDRGRLVKWGYVTTPPRTLAFFCAHELTHIVVTEHIGAIAALRQPTWVHEGFPDYVGIERRQSFDELRRALGDRPVDVPMMQQFGSYPRYRLLVTFFLERKGWPVERLLATQLSYEQAMALMMDDTRR